MLHQRVPPTSPGEGRLALAPELHRACRSPTACSGGDVDLAFFSGSETNGARRLAVDHFDASRQLEQHLHAIYCPAARAGSTSPRPRLLRASARRPWRRRPRRRGLVLASRRREEVRTVLRRSRARVAVAQVLRASPARREPHIRRVEGFPLGSRAGRSGVLRRRRRHAIEHLADDVLGRDPLHPQLGAQHEAMCERRNGDGLHIVRKHEVATL